MTRAHDRVDVAWAVTRDTHRRVARAGRLFGAELLRAASAYYGVARALVDVYGAARAEALSWGVWCAPVGACALPAAWLTSQLGYGPVRRMTEAQARASAALLERAGAMTGYWRYEARPLSDRPNRPV